MSDTYVARAEGCTMESMSLGHIWANCIGVKNASDYDLEIRRIYIEPTLAWNDELNTVGQQGGTMFSVYRSTAEQAAVGEDLSVVKHDTAGADLPSQVHVRKHASVTLGSVINRPGQNCGIKRSTQPIFSSRHHPAPPWDMINGTYRSGGFVQPQVLREGQGLAVVNDQPGVRPRVQWLNATFRNQATGDTYQVISKPVPTAENDVMLSIYNGSGSGVILEVMRVESYDVGYQSLNAQDNDGSSGIGFDTYQGPPEWRLCMVADILDGETVPIIKRDTDSAALPAGISVIKHGQAIPLAGVSTYAYRDSALNSPSTGGDLIYGLQLQNVIRALHSTPHQSVSPQSSAQNVKRFMTGNVRDLYRAPPISGAGWFVKKGLCLSLCWWYRSTVEGAAPALPWPATNTNCIDDEFSTLMNHNITIEFNVSVGPGTPLSGPTLINGPLIG